MMHGRRRDGRSLQLTMGREHLVNRSECLALELPSHRVGASHVRIDNSQQAHWLPLQLKLFIDTRVIPSEYSYTYNCNRNRILTGQGKFSLASCRRNCKCKCSKEHSIPSC